MDSFIRKDGISITIVPGFREQYRYFGKSVNPKKHWSNRDYHKAAELKIEKHVQLVSAYKKMGGNVEGARIVELGCGAGIDALLWAMEPVAEVVGVDTRLRLFIDNDEGERTRKLVGRVLDLKGFGIDIEHALDSLPIRLEALNVMNQPFNENSFDFLYSRSALEHFIPLEDALIEMSRIVRPGGLIHHIIDPFYWYRGCHRGALIDIPWAHARLSPEEFQDFVSEYEGKKMGRRRVSQLEELNRFTLKQWREVIEQCPWEIIEWEEQISEVAEKLLAQFPEVENTLVSDIEHRDLVVNRIRIWLRNTCG